MSERDDPSYGELATQLLDDGKNYAKSKALLYRALVKYRATQMRLPAVLFMLAVALTSAALMAILLGIVLALASTLGGLAAGMLVGVVGLVLAAALVIVGWKLMPDLDESPFHDGGRINDPTSAELEQDAAEDLVGS